MPDKATLKHKTASNKQNINNGTCENLYEKCEVSFVGKKITGNSVKYAQRKRNCMPEISNAIIYAFITIYQTLVKHKLNDNRTPCYYA